MSNLLQEKYTQKIAKLLNKAESTTAEEAELLVAKAQELMTEYAIEQAMIDEALGASVDEIEQRSIFFTGNMRKELAMMALDIIRINDCKSIWYDTTHDDGGRKAVKAYPGRAAVVTSEKKAIRLLITGFRSDLERVLMLETSLRLQAMNGMLKWWKDEGQFQYDWYTYAKKVRIKQEYIEGFAEAVTNRLRDAKSRGQSNAIKEEAKRELVTVEEATESVALVLRARKDRVQDWYDKKYGNSLRSLNLRYKNSVSDSALNAGKSDGSRADIGQSKLRQRGQLNK